MRRLVQYCCLVQVLALTGWLLGGLDVAPPALAGAACPSAPVDDQPPNWGALGGSAADCESERAAEVPPNWGALPPKVVTVQLVIDGAKTEVVQLPEAVGQAAGEAGIAVGQGDTPDTGSDHSRPTIMLDPKWANVIQWDSDILAAQEQVRQETDILVPTTVIRAIMMIETQGVMPDAVNYAGAGGLMQITPSTIGAAHYDFARISSDAAYSIYAGTYELALRYRDSGMRAWENVAVGYFSGHYDPNGSSDAYNSDFDYLRLFQDYMGELESALKGTSGAGAADIAVIWGNLLFGNAPPSISQPFGPTDFSKFVHPDWYEYSLAYGFDAPGHTGLDVAIPAGTPLYAPEDGTVVCAGTDNGDGEDSCAAFVSAYGGPTSGRLQLKLPNDDMLILGHVNASVVNPGDHVTAGQQIGISGGFNGDHVHIEYRIRDFNTASTWRIIDPRLRLNGQGTMPIPAATTTSGPVENPQTQPPAESPDPDRDGISAPLDNCPSIANLGQEDADGDGAGDACDDTPLPPTDTDGDGIVDAAERISYGTDPANWDTDGDGLGDGAEVNQFRTNPTVSDTDGDGINDGQEVANGTDPTTVDTGTPSPTNSPPGADVDQDGLSAEQEIQHGTNPTNSDTDGDGLGDGAEVSTGSDPTNPNNP